MAFNAPPAAPNKPKTPPAAVENRPKPAKSSSSAATWTWGTTARVGVSLLVIFHLTAVFSAPWSLQLEDLYVNVPNLPPGTSSVPDAMGRPIPLDKLSRQQVPPMEPRLPHLLANNPVMFHYKNLLYINHGYDFFSPDPSVSHVLRYTVRDDRGDTIATGEFPNRKEQWPRLFYHRHMMLVDQSSNAQLAAARWETRIAKQLLEEHNGASVEMKFYVHHLLRPEQALAGDKLDGDPTYELVGQMQQRRGELLPALPTAPPTGGPAIQSAVRIPQGGLQ